MTITTNPPRSRAPRRMSVLFCSLDQPSRFWLPTRKGALIKTSFCTARAVAGEATTFAEWGKKTPLQFINPFRSVLVKAPDKMTKALMKALCAPSPFINFVEPKSFPAGIGEAVREPGCCGGKCPCDRPRGDEPHNDNNITGPTC